MRLPRYRPVLLAACLFLVLLVCRGSLLAQRSADRSELPSGFRGSGSCSAVACHGSIAPRGGLRILGNEHTTWISDDRHSRAYETLFSETSERIVRILAGEAARHRPAYEDERCLACHTTPRAAEELARTCWMNQDGVGCESCHGASGKWLGRHTTAGWREITDPRQKEADGFVNTKDLSVRASVCAGCHVGQYSSTGLLARDVNHDLVAAGHPRLNFELSAYLENMPPHWEEKGPNAGAVGASKAAANFPARAWAIGQLATARASLELLSQRAADAQAPWPEFTEYGCFDCHHSLRDEAWRRRRLAATTPGAPAWGSWTQPMTSQLIRELVTDPAARAYAESLKNLTREMAKPVPDRKLVGPEAEKAAGALLQCLGVVAESPLGAPEVQRLLDTVNSREARSGLSSWDAAAQHYLALVPLYQASLSLYPDRVQEKQALRAELDVLLKRLKFPAGYNSPTGFDPGRFRGER